MLNTTISFNFEKKKYSWTFEHNLHEYGMSIDAAFLNWSARLNKLQKPVQADFCNYILSKDPNFKCNISSLISKA